MTKVIRLLIFLVALPASLLAQGSDIRQKAERNLTAFFATYHTDDAYFAYQPRLKSLTVDDKLREVKVVADASFAQQDFTEKTVNKIYKHIKKALPKPLNKYALTVSTNGLPIEYFIPDYQLNNDEGHALWGRIDYTGKPWVSNASSPLHLTKGLNGRHLTVWASHGRYYNNNNGRWQWQRPQLFGTSEDLFTQTIVVPYLIPMLEKAGANVFTPRERDWQTAEYVIDPDGGISCQPNDYQEFGDRNN